MDFLGRFERLQEDFKEVGQRIGLHGLELSSHQKFGNTGRLYLDYYGGKEEELAKFLVSRESSMFGYSFTDGAC